MVATAVKEIPILFQTPMVKAILEGRKTVTRRVVKIPKWATFNNASVSDDKLLCNLLNDVGYYEAEFKAKPADILWVRETWSKIHYEGVDPEPTYIYKADDEAGHIQGIWKPSIHMPKAACRLKLEVLSIRVERLHEITEEDAIREGVQSMDFGFGQTSSMRYRDYVVDASGYGHPDHDFPTVTDARDSFITLWQKINGKESWSANPWIWRVEFRKLDRESIK